MTGQFLPLPFRVCVYDLSLFPTVLRHSTQFSAVGCVQCTFHPTHMENFHKYSSFHFIRHAQYYVPCRPVRIACMRRSTDTIRRSDHWYQRHPGRRKRSLYVRILRLHAAAWWRSWTKCQQNYALHCSNVKRAPVFLAQEKSSTYTYVKC